VGGAGSNYRGGVLLVGSGIGIRTYGMKNGWRHSKGGKGVCGLELLSLVNNTGKKKRRARLSLPLADTSLDGLWSGPMVET